MTPSIEPFVLDYISVISSRPRAALTSVSVAHTGTQIQITGALDDGSAIQYSALWPWDWAPALQSSIQQLVADQCEQARQKLLALYAGFARDELAH